MELKKCPECGKEVNDFTEICSQCGYPLKNIPISRLNHNAVKTDISGFVAKNRQIISITTSVLMIIIGLTNFIWFVQDGIQLIDEIFDIFRYDLGLDLLTDFMCVISDALGAIGFIGTGILLVINKCREYLKITPILIGTSYLTIVLYYLMWFLFGGFWIGYIIRAFIGIPLGILWIIGTLALNKNTSVNVRNNIQLILTIAPIVLLLLFMICNFSYIMDRIEGWHLFVIIVEFMVLPLFVLSKSTFVEEGESQMNIEQVKPYAVTEKDVQINSSNQRLESTAILPNGYLKVWVLIVLSIVTLGVYSYIWIYRTVGFLNSKKLGEEQSQGIQLVLCLFVPFYIIYWLYKQSKLIEIYTLKAENKSNDLSVITLILAVFGLSLVSVALMQDQINKNLIAETNGIYNQSSYVPTENMNEEVTAVEPSFMPVVEPQALVERKNVLSNDDVEILRKIKELYDLGVLTEEEYRIEKGKVLGK